MREETPALFIVTVEAVRVDTATRRDARFAILPLEYTRVLP